MNLRKLLTTGLDSVKGLFTPRKKSWEKPPKQPKSSKHYGAKTRPRGWHTRLRKERKRAKLARRAQRGKR